MKEENHILKTDHEILHYTLKVDIWLISTDIIN